MHLGIPHLGLNAIGSLFGPASLFAGGAQGVWYDPSDFTSLYQDPNGMTPVTAFEQPVGLVLDKSQGAPLGTELCTDPTLDNPAAWSFTGTAPLWSVTGGKAVVTATGTANRWILNGTPLVIGKWYRVKADVIVTAGLVGPDMDGNNGDVSVSGTYTWTLKASVTTLQFIARSTFIGSIDNVSVKPIAGNHANQTTTTQRPVLSARYNLLAPSESMAGWTVRLNNSISQTGNVTTLTNSGDANPSEGVWAEVAGGNTAYTLTVKAFSGSLSQMNIVIKDRGTDTVRANSVVTLGATERTFSVSGTTAGTSTGLRIEVTTNGVNGSINVTGVDVRLASDAALSIPAYQQVTSGTVYATSGFPAYLRFDGVSDNLATGAINWGTPKITVFSGVTKLSDATVGVIAGLSDPNVNHGSFEMRGPHANATANYGGNYSGATAITGFASASSFAAPNSAVLTMPMDLGAPSLDVRVSAVDQGQTNAVTGGGNFGNFPIYLGSRGGTSVYFNGRLYSVIAVGASEPANTITFTERWIGQKMGIGGL